MATLTVLKFDTAEGADVAAQVLVGLTSEPIVIHDAAIVSWASHTRKPRTRELADLAGHGALGSAFWGLLFGLVFFVPLLGAAIGAATGAASGSLADVGIDDAFVNRVRDEITPGTSALFVLTPDAAVQALKQALTRHQPSELLFTNLSPDEEAALREVFTD